MKRNGYRKQMACINCKHCFIREEYDEGDRYFCTLGADKRPPCMSVLMNDPKFCKRTARRVLELTKAWRVWADKNAVNPHGICTKWKDKES